MVQDTKGFCLSDSRQTELIQIQHTLEAERRHCFSPVLMGSNEQRFI